jgi:hypothetical protein
MMKFTMGLAEISRSVRRVRDLEVKNSPVSIGGYVFLLTA